MNEDEKLKIGQALVDEFPQKLRYAVQNSYFKNMSDEEMQELRRIFRVYGDKIAEAIASGMKCSENKAYSLVEGVFDMHSKKISEALETSRKNSLDNSADEVFSETKKRMSMVEQIPDLQAQEVELKNNCGNIVLYTERSFGDNSRKERLAYFSKLEDIVMTEMKAEFKRNLMNIDERRGEDTIYDVSRVLYHGVVQELENSYEKNTRDLSKAITYEVEKEAADVTNYYSRIAGPAYDRQQEESTKKDGSKKTLDLSEFVESSEEVAKRDIDHIIDPDEALREKIRRVNEEYPLKDNFY